jgi:hypothetical protein
MSNIWPEVTSDEIDPADSLDQSKRDEEILRDVPPHHS